VQIAQGKGARNIQTGGAPYIERAENVIVSPPPLERAPTGSTPPPARTAHYVRRGKIEDDVRAALAAQTSVAVVGVAGMGGIGKTELANFLAREFEKTHRVIWLGVFNNSVSYLQGELARALGFEFDPRADDASRYATLRAVLRDNPHIIFFDDVYREAIPHLQFLLPPSPPCAALITSRQRELGGVRVFQLDVMDQAQALELLREAHNLGDVIAREPDAAQTLCELCGYLPLALDLAASRLRKQLHFSTTPIAAFNQALANRLKELQRSADSDAHLQSITANLDLSYDILDDADKRRLRALAVFAPSGFAPRAAAALWNETEADACAHIERLQDESLVMNVKEKIGRFRLHDLVRDYAAQKLNASDEGDAANRAHAEFLIALFGANYVPDLRSLPELLPEQDNLVLAGKWAQEKNESRLLALLVTRPQNWWRVNFREAWNDWTEMLTTALRVAKDYEPALQANVLQAIGDIQQFRKENDAALKSYADALALFRSVGDRLGEANVLKAIGDIQQFRDERDAALKSYADALALFRSVGARLGEANVLQAIGDIQQFRDERDAALKSYADALALFRSVGARLGEANVLTSRGKMLLVGGDLQIGIQELQDALNLNESIGNLPGQANIYFFLGQVLESNNQIDKAIEMVSIAVSLGEKIDPNHPVSQYLRGYLEKLKAQKS
jgi:tetratricopeptide (TPR) repeat protein